MAERSVPRDPQTRGSTRVVLIALALAVVAVVLNNVYIAVVRRQAVEDTFAVYITTKTLRPGDRIRRGDVERVDVPMTFKRAFSQLDALDEPGLTNREQSGEPVQEVVPQGQLLTYTAFNPSLASSLDQETTAGRRLVTLPVNSREGFAVLRPGMYVDVAAAFDRGGRLPETLTVMERVQVKAVGTRTEEQINPRTGQPMPVGNFRTIIIEVTPEQAVDLSNITRLAVGDFELYGRNPADRDTPEIEGEGINPEVLDLVRQAQRSATARR